MVKIQNGKRYLVNIPSYSDYNEGSFGGVGGDVSSAGSSSSETSSITPDDALVDLSGSTYTGGPYDTFEAYSSGSNPSNDGYGWASAWEIRTPTSRDFPLIIAIDDLSYYASGSDPNGVNGGTGWNSGVVVN